MVFEILAIYVLLTLFYDMAHLREMRQRIVYYERYLVLLFWKFFPPISHEARILTVVLMFGPTMRLNTYRPFSAWTVLPQEPRFVQPTALYQGGLACGDAQLLLHLSSTRTRGHVSRHFWPLDHLVTLGAILYRRKIAPAFATSLNHTAHVRIPRLFIYLFTKIKFI